MRPTKLQILTKTALMAAVISVLAQVTLPFSAVPLTLQTFAIAFCGYYLGGKHGALTVLVYLLMGAIGLPVFSAFGATAAFLGPTGGFLVGFLPLSLLCGISAPIGKIKSLLLSACGLFLCHALGVLWYAFVMKLSPFSAFLLVSAPYLPKDVLSLILAKMLAKRLQKTHRKT